MSDRADELPLVVAHRGDSRNAPENTLAAFRLALEAGADGIEFDVQLAKDGVPVVIHDFTLKRTAGRQERVSDLTAAELAGLNAGGWFNRKFPALARSEYSREHVPTLAEVLETASDFERIYVELKCDKADDYAALATTVSQMLRDFPALDRVVVKSFKLATLPIVKSVLPDVTTAALFAPTIVHFLRKKEYIIELAREMAADELSLHTSLATKHLARIAADAGMPITVWTADNPAWIGKARGRSLRAIITNNPRVMLLSRIDTITATEDHRTI
jgi:glycerophosphoryl diester phosphodiesterase